MRDTDDTESTELEWFKSSLSFSNGNCVEVAWHKSSASAMNGNCIEAGGGTCGMIHVRDSKNPDGPQLLFTLAEWRAFVGGAKLGDFDNIIS